METCPRGKIYDCVSAESDLSTVMAWDRTVFSDKPHACDAREHMLSSNTPRACDAANASATAATVPFGLQLVPIRR